MDIELRVSQELIDKLVSAGVLELEEVNDPEKVADAIEGAVWNLPDSDWDNTKEIASAIEQFMSDRGEYTYAGDGVRWITSDDREATTQHIADALRKGDFGNKDDLVKYLEGELAVMDEADEQVARAKAILGQLENIATVYGEKTIEEWGEKALLDCNFGDTSIQILSAGYDDYIRTETIKAAFQEYCEHNDGYASFSDYFTDKMNTKFFSETGTDLEYDLLESIKEKASLESEDFLDSFVAFADDLPPSEVLKRFGYEGYEVDLTDFLKHNYVLNLMMATENELNFDSTGLMQCYGDIPSTANLSEEDFKKYADNALSYLIQQQGHTVEEAMGVMVGTERTNNEFINSVRDEVESLNYQTGLLTVCVTASGQELLDLLDAIASKEQNLKFSEQTNLCIHDKWNGSTSAIDITLESDAVFPASMVHEVQFESSGRDDRVAQVSHEWTVNEVCDLIGSVWTDGNVKITDEAPVLMQENLAETQKQVVSKVALMEKSDKHKEFVDD